MTEGFEKFKNHDSDNNKDKAIAALEEEVHKLKDRLSEERFYWIFGIIIGIDLFAFAHMESWGGPVSIAILELIGLIALANKCGVDVIVTLTERVIAGWHKNNGAEIDKH